MKITNAYKTDEVKKQELTSKHFEKVEEEHKKAVAKYEGVPEDIANLQQQLELEIAENENKQIEVVRYVIPDNEETYKWDGVKPVSTKRPF